MLSPPFEAPAAMQRHRAISDTERSEIQAVLEYRSTRIGDISAELARLTLLQIDPDLHALQVPQKAQVLSVTPTPGSYLLKKAFQSVAGPEDSTTIKAFIREVALPVAGLRQDPKLSSVNLATDLDRLVACSQAESRFMQAAEQIRFREKESLQPLVRAYYDAEGIVALGKTIMEDSALLLRSTREVPAGTIVSIDPRTLGDTHTRHYESWTEQACEIDETLSVQPVRITPWAYQDPLNRAAFAVTRDSGYYIEYEGTTYASTALEDFRHAAARILFDCDITPTIEPGHAALAA